MADRQTRILAFGLWWMLLLAAFLLAPPVRADWGPWAFRLAMGDWTGEEPLIVVVFNTMGVVPLLFASLLRDSLRARPVPAWPFVLASGGMGIFALLPYLVVRSNDSTVRPLRPTLQRLFGGQALPMAMVVVLGLLGAWGLREGDGSQLSYMMRHDGFVAVMTLDFVLCHTLFAAMAWERGMAAWQVALIPCVGPPLCLLLDRIVAESEAE